jgi:hypothetical protein
MLEHGYPKRREHFPSARVLSLSALWERYKTESVTFQDYTMRMKKEFESRVQILYRFFGEDCDVRGLTEQDQAAFVKKRLAGGIVTGRDADGKDKLTRAVRARSAQADVEVLRSMIHWATTFRVRSGVRLLDRNPLAGVRMPARGSNPRRPVATQERFTATRQAIALLRDEAETESGIVLGVGETEKRRLLVGGFSGNDATSRRISDTRKRERGLSRMSIENRSM